MRARLRWVRLGVCRWQQKEPRDAQYGSRERLQQTRSDGRMFGALHTLYLHFTGAPATRAGCWFKADSRSKVRYSALQGLSGHQNDTRRRISRRQIRWHYRPDNVKMFDLETSPSPRRRALRIPSVEFSIGRYVQGNVPMRQLLAGPFRPVGGMVIGWPPVAVCQRDVGEQYRPSRLCSPENKIRLAQVCYLALPLQAALRV